MWDKARAIAYVEKSKWLLSCTSRPVRLLNSKMKTIELTSLPHVRILDPKSSRNWTAKMPEFSKQIMKMPRSGIREIMELAWSMDGDGDGELTRLMVGEPDFETPTHIVKAAQAALSDGFTRYISNAGLPELRSAIAKKFEQTYGVDTSQEQVTITHGAMGAITSAIAITCDAGDDVLIPDPGWPNYISAAMLLNARAVPYPLKIENEFQPVIEEIEACVTPRCKAIVLCSPSNPTGQVYSAETIRQLVELARKHDLFVISDEIYADIIFEGTHNSAAEFDTDGRVIVANGFSKSYSMTGFRVGYLRAGTAFSALAAKVQEPLITCGTASSQYAALEAITGPQDCIKRMVDEYRERRNLVSQFMDEHGLKQYTPRGAFYYMIDVSSSGLGGQEFALELLRKHRVAVAPGPTFGESSGKYIRISLASSRADLIKGLSAITKLIEQGPS